MSYNIDTGAYQVLQPVSISGSLCVDGTCLTGDQLRALQHPWGWLWSTLDFIYTALGVMMFWGLVAFAVWALVKWLQKVNAAAQAHTPAKPEVAQSDIA